MQTKPFQFRHGSLLSAAIFSVLLVSSHVAHAVTPLKLQNGDLIFHKSKGPQAKAILEATGSAWSHVGIILEQSGQWVVAEASMPVRIVSLQTFINRGVGKNYRIRESDVDRYLSERSV